MILEGSSNTVFDVDESWTTEEDEVFQVAAQMVEIKQLIEESARMNTLADFYPDGPEGWYESMSDAFDAGINDGEILFARQLLKILKG